MAGPSAPRQPHAGPGVGTHRRRTWLWMESAARRPRGSSLPAGAAVRTPHPVIDAAQHQPATASGPRLQSHTHQQALVGRLLRAASLSPALTHQLARPRVVAPNPASKPSLGPVHPRRGFAPLRHPRARGSPRDCAAPFLSSPSYRIYWPSLSVVSFLGNRLSG